MSLQQRVLLFSVVSFLDYYVTMKLVALLVVLLLLVTLLTGTSGRKSSTSSSSATGSVQRSHRRRKPSSVTGKGVGGNSTAPGPQRKSKARRCRNKKRAKCGGGGKRNRKSDKVRRRNHRKLSRHHRKLIMRRFHSNLEEFNNETDSAASNNKDRGPRPHLPSEALVPPFFLNETLTGSGSGGRGGGRMPGTSGVGNCTESSAAVPNFMVWLYDSKALRDGNTVRSLYACAGDSLQRHKKGQPILIDDDVTMRRDVVFAFNASKIPKFEDLTKSELRLQVRCKSKQQQQQQQQHVMTSSSGGDVTQKATVAVYERVVDEKGMFYRNVTEIGMLRENMAERSVIGGDERFLNYVITARRDPRFLLIVRLANDVTTTDVTPPPPNHRFRVVVGANSPERSKRRSDDDDDDVINATVTSLFPILVVYGHDARSVVPMTDPAAKLKLLHAEAAPHGTPPPPPNILSRTRRSADDVIKLNMTSAANGGRRRGGGRRKARGRTVDVTSPTATNTSSDADDDDDGDGLCGVRSFYINFNKLGWYNWIVAPAGYDMSYCGGRCEVDSHVEMTNHAVMQWLVRKDGASQIKPPCCVPNELGRISILYLDSTNQVVLKVYPDMVARSCSCR